MLATDPLCHASFAECDGLEMTMDVKTIREGGSTDRLSPAFYADAVDFTVTHPWWLDDAVLWDTLVAKVANKPLLVQEVGQQRLPQINGVERRTPQDVSNLIERKVAIAGETSAGAIEWLWHTNGFMKNDNEMPIGALREDGTEKPEAEMLRRFSQFAAATQGLLSAPEPRDVALVTSQALQYSGLNAFAIEAQQKAVRALEYYCRIAGRIVTENRLAELGSPKLAILVSPQALSDEAWTQLLKYVEGGGTLLVSGSMERDPHWQVTHRLRDVGLDAVPQPLFYRQGQIDLGMQTIPLSYDGDKQQFLEALTTADGKTFHELHKGKGIIYLTSFPAELASGLDSTVALYRWALQKVGIESPFVGTLPSPGVLIRRSVFKDSLMYLFVSEGARDEQIAIKDKVTGADFNFRLAAQRARLVLLDRKTRKVLADFRDVPHIESTTIGFLVSIYTSVTRKGGGRFVLAGPSPRVRQVLDLMRLSTVIPLAPDFESGLALLRAEGVANPGPFHLDNTAAFIHDLEAKGFNSIVKR